MTSISETELARICDGISEDREIIIKHNPMGTPTEILLWMLLGCLASYLSLEEADTPCFTGKPDAETYRDAILFVLRNRLTADFDPRPYIERVLHADQDTGTDAISTKHAGRGLRDDA
jgi:hypothetical protein